MAPVAPVEPLPGPTPPAPASSPHRDGDVEVSVAICTWNRAALLDRTLESFHQLEPAPDLRWELLIVENNCTDATPEVVRRHADHLPVRLLSEPQQGHSAARNRAVQAARGELILWTDDDVQVSPNWIRETVRVARQHPDAGYFGGRVVPWFADSVPLATRQLIEANLDQLATIYSLKDYGPAIRPFAAGEMPFGGNMAFRTALLRRFPFNPRLGRVKTDLIGGDEIAVLQALQAEGIPGYWIGSTTVRHLIQPDRTSFGHFWRHYHDLGRTHVRLHGAPVTAMLGGRPRWALVAEWKHRVRGWMRRQLGHPDWLRDYLRAAWLAGLGHETAQARAASAASHPAAPPTAAQSRPATAPPSHELATSPPRPLDNTTVTE